MRSDRAGLAWRALAGSRGSLYIRSPLRLGSARNVTVNLSTSVADVRCAGDTMCAPGIPNKPSFLQFAGYSLLVSRYARQAAARQGLSEARLGYRDRIPGKRGPGTR